MTDDTMQVVYCMAHGQMLRLDEGGLLVQNMWLTVAARLVVALVSRQGGLNDCSGVRDSARHGNGMLSR